MVTTQRLGIDIVGTDKTRGGFASAQRSMAGLNRSVGQLKGALAGIAGGNLLAGFVRSMISVNREVPLVKAAFDNLALAWTGFALKVGEGGLNAALVNFSNRIGSMIVGTDGLSASIGGFLGGSVNVMAGIFEGIGRSIAFVYDNFEIFKKGLYAFAAVQIAGQLMALGRGFVLLISTLRAAGTATAIFSLIQRRMLLFWAAIIAVGAKVTGTFEDLTAVINNAFEAANKLVPVLMDDVVGGLGQMGLDVKSLTGSFGDYEASLAGIPAASDLAAGATKKLGAAAKSIVPEVSPVAEALKNISQSFSSAFGSAFDSVIEGTSSVKAAFGDMAQSILSSMASMAADKLFSGLFGSLLGGLVGGAAAPAGAGGFSGFYAKGGQLRAGQWGIAGEAGPEIIHGPATITPVAQSRNGGGNTIIVNFNGSNNDATGMAMLRADVQNLRKSMPQIIKSGVTHERSRNPGFAR